MSILTSAEMRDIHEEFVQTYMVGSDNIVGVGRIKLTPFAWAIRVTARDPSNVSWPYEFRGMKVLVEQGEPGILAVA